MREGGPTKFPGEFQQRLVALAGGGVGGRAERSVNIRSWEQATATGARPGRAMQSLPWAPGCSPQRRAALPRHQKARDDLGNTDWVSALCPSGGFLLPSPQDVASLPASVTTNPCLSLLSCLQGSAQAWGCCSAWNTFPWVFTGCLCLIQQGPPQRPGPAPHLRRPHHPCLLFAEACLSLISLAVRAHSLFLLSLSP